MARKRFATEQIIGLLREEEVRLGQGQTIGTICRAIGWIRPRVSKYDRLKQAVPELTLDKLILKEDLEGKYQLLHSSSARAAQPRLVI